MFNCYLSKKSIFPNTDIIDSTDKINKKSIVSDIDIVDTNDIAQKINKISLNTFEYKKFDLNNTTGYYYVESIYDGDTITVLIPIKLHIYNMLSNSQIDESSDTNKSNSIYLNKVKLRLMGIDTPEMKPSKDTVGRDELIKKAEEAKEFLSNMILGKIIKIEILSNDKYGRPLANLYLNDKCLNELMVEKGFAKNYNGGTKDTNF